MPSFDVEAAIEETIAAFSPPHFDADVSSDEDTGVETEELIEIPPELTNATDITRTPTRSSTTSVEPLSIKKKNSVKPRKSPGRSTGKSPGKSPNSFRRIRVSEPSSPSVRPKLNHTTSMVKASPRNRPSKGKQVDRMMVVAKTTKEDVGYFLMVVSDIANNLVSFHLLEEPSNVLNKKSISSVRMSEKI
jgi:hypothetical protein